MSKKIDLIDWMQRWVSLHADGNFEETHNLTIETLDVPGWTIDINLEGTYVEEMPFEVIEIQRGPHDWLCCARKRRRFQATCGPLNLKEVLHIFREWVDGCSLLD